MLLNDFDVYTQRKRDAVEVRTDLGINHGHHLEAVSWQGDLGGWWWTILRDDGSVLAMGWVSTDLVDSRIELGRTLLSRRAIETGGIGAEQGAPRLEAS